MYTEISVLWVPKNNSSENSLKIAWNHKAPYLTLFVTLCVELRPFHNVLDVDGTCGGSIQLQAAPIHTQWRGGVAHGRVLITAAMTPSRELCFSHLQCHICLVLPNLLTQFQWDTGAGIHQYVFGVYAPSLFSLAPSPSQSNESITAQCPDVVTQSHAT